MRFLRIRTFLPAALALVALPAGALAAGPRADAISDRRARVLDRIEAVRIARMTEALDLDSKTAEKLFPALQPITKRRRAALEERLVTMRDLRQQLNADSPDAKQVAGLLDRMASNQKEFCDIQQGEYKTLKGILDPVTMAKYYKFQIEFERQIGQMIRGVRQGGGTGDGRPFRRHRRRFAPDSGADGVDPVVP